MANLRKHFGKQDAVFGSSGNKARVGVKGAVHCSKSRENNKNTHNIGSSWSHGGNAQFDSDNFGSLDCLEGKNGKVGNVGKQIDGSDNGDGNCNSKRQISFGIFAALSNVKTIGNDKE